MAFPEKNQQTQKPPRKNQIYIQYKLVRSAEYTSLTRKTRNITEVIRIITSLSTNYNTLCDVSDPRHWKLSNDINDMILYR